MLVGHAQSKLKLFLHIIWSVPNHIKINRTPNKPVMKNKKPSKPERNFSIRDFFEKLKKAIRTNAHKTGALNCLFCFENDRF